MIYEIKRDNTVIFQHEIKGRRTRSAPAVDFVDIEFDYYEAIDLKKNDTIIYKGDTYYCDKQTVNIVKKSTNLYSHRAKFLGENYKATEIALLDSEFETHIFEIEGNLLTLVTLAVSNLNRVDSGWSYDTTDFPDTITKLFKISDENVMSFIAKLSGEFEIPFVIKDKIIKFLPNLSTEYAGDLSYGRGKGFLNLTKSYKNDKVANTIYASGGEDFQLSHSVEYEPHILENGVIEGFYSNERIFPTTRTQITGVVTQNNVVTTNLISYNLEDYLIQGQRAIVNFETGSLAGLSFFAENVEKIAGVTLIYLQRRTIDGVEYPNNSARPANSDFFNITNISMPAEIVEEASIKLRDYAVNFLMRSILSNMVIQGEVDPLVINNLQLNDSINITDVNLNLDNQAFYVTETIEHFQDLQKLEIKLEIYIEDNPNLLNLNLDIVNENIIDLQIGSNYDLLVGISDRVIVRDGGNLLTPDFALIDSIRNEYRFGNASIRIDRESGRGSSFGIGGISWGNTLLSANPDVDSVIRLPQTGSLLPKTLTTSYVFNKTTYDADDSGVMDLTPLSNAINDIPLANNGSINYVGVGNIVGGGVSNANQSISTSYQFDLTPETKNNIAKAVTALQAEDLDGFIYDVTYTSNTHVLTFYRQNQPNIVIDLPIEQLIKGVQLVGDDLVFTFEDGSTVTVPMNTLLVGVVKKVNGLTPNSQGEVVINIADIPGLSTELNKIGALSTLTTTNKNNLVDAINEVNGNTNNIEIGGRNLLLSSSPIVSWEGVHTVTTSSGAFVFTNNYETELLYQIEARTNDPNLIGKEFGFQFSSILQGKSIMLTNQWQKAYCIVPLGFTGALGLRVSNGTGVLELRKIKAEKGNIPTDWTPAIEDQVSDWNETDSTKFSYIKNKPTIPNVTGFLPYTGANQSIDLNTQKITHDGIVSHIRSITSQWIVQNTVLSSTNKVAYLIIDGFTANTNRQLYIEVESVAGNGQFIRLVKGFNVFFTNANEVASFGDSRYLEVTGTGADVRYGIGEVEKYSNTALKIPLIWLSSGAQSINKISVKAHTGSVSNLIFSIEYDATSTLTTENPYLYRNASEKWVNQQIDDISIPTNYITTDTNQTGLSGNKTTSGTWTFTPTTNSSIPITGMPSATIVGRASQGSALVGYNDVGDISYILRGFQSNSIQLDLRQGNVSSLGYIISGRNNSDIVLAGGGHRPVSDFALSGSLGNYLPLAGGTMDNGSVINWNSGTSAVIQLGGNNRIRVTFSNTFISSSVSGTTDGIYLRPRGDINATGQVRINGNGQITTHSHGDSSQWHEAYQATQNLSTNYVPINGVTTINNTKTFTSSPVVPNGTLAGHAVNLGQLNSALDGNYEQDILYSTDFNTADVVTLNNPTIFYFTSFVDQLVFQVGSIKKSDELVVHNTSGVDFEFKIPHIKQNGYTGDNNFVLGNNKSVSFVLAYISGNPYFAIKHVTDIV